MPRRLSRYLGGGLFVPALVLSSGVLAQTPATGEDDGDARPPVTAADLQIVKRARAILSSERKWNRADTRICAPDSQSVSLYCALQAATIEVSGKAEHRRAALQEVRFVIDEITVERNYHHRLMDYNNDPTTTFADVQEVLRITESLIRLRLKAGGVGR
jgi:hypothetical protein